jgi:PAS domain S-box-containing protein
MRGVDTNGKDRLNGKSAVEETGKGSSNRECSGVDEHYRILFEMGPATMIVGEDGIVFMANEQFANLVGVRREDIENKMRWNEFFRPGDLTRIRGYHEAGKESGNIPAEYEARLSGKDGDERAVLVRAAAVPGSSTTVISVNDISKRKKMEKSLRRTNERLQKALQELKNTEVQVIQQERLNALGQMARGITHDLNNTLTPILGYADFLVSDPSILDDKNECVSMLKDIRSAAQDARGIISRIREFYKPADNAERTRLKLGEVVRNAVERTRPRWQEEMRSRGVKIEICQDIADHCEVLAQESQILEVVTNLILNAVDVLEDGGGSISISCSKDENGWICLEVADNGRGMTEEVRRRCLEPFFSEKATKGTGLGLSTAYGIVQRHQGHIEIESEQGAGTRVKVHLPPAEERQQRTHIRESAATTPVQMKILCIDDDIRALKLLERYLSSEGHEVVQASSGADGVRAFRNGGFSAVLVDRAMPGMRGDEVISEIRGLDPGVPIIMLTGFAEIMQIERDMPEGADAVLAKPVLRETLMNALARACGLHGDGGA